MTIGLIKKPYALVVGIGKTGFSIARYLKSKEVSFAVYDTRDKPSELFKLREQYPEVDCHLGEIAESVLSEINCIYMSPGVTLELPVIQQAIQKGIPVIGDIECLAQEINSPVIAITGTNGKSTVTTLVGEMAAAAGIKTAVGGNLGTPVLDLLLNGKSYGLWVLELSSFQLELTHTLKPLAATILNITPDHLDRHHSLAAYIAAKQRVYHSAQTLIYNREDQQTFPISNTIKTVSFGLDVPQKDHWGLIENAGQLVIAFGKEVLIPVSDLKIKGRHNWSNAIAACALAQAAGITFDIMISVLRNFSGLSHRTMHVRHLDGVDWINDSKGTNVGATCSAITGMGAAMNGKIILLAGGQGKGADFTILRDAVSEYVRTLIVFGEDAPLIRDALSDIVEVIHVADLKEAVNLARVVAIKGDAVLLSPACASFDMFRDFNHRGVVFTDLVSALGTS